MSKSKLLVFSGIEPGKKGAGNFVSFFLRKLDEFDVDYELHTLNTPDGRFVKLLKKIGWHKFLKQVYYLYVQTFKSYSKKTINASILLLHPQSLGLKKSIELIENNRVFFYVFDNFLFCKKSYNYIHGENACLLCLSKVDAASQNNCKSFPIEYSDSIYLKFLSTIRNNKENVHFLVQNLNQQRIVRNYFGLSCNISNVGMMIDLDSDEKTLVDSESVQYDFLYHNTLSNAKGLSYFLNLSKVMLGYTFVIPSSRKEVVAVTGLHEFNENVVFIEVYWGGGLKELLVSCSVVINPTLWSAPVEGALLKSLFYNGCVAVVPVDYSFQDELPDNVVLKLSSDYSEAKEALITLIASEEKRLNLKNNARKWINNYIQIVNENFNLFFKKYFLDFTNSFNHSK